MIIIIIISKRMILQSEAEISEQLVHIHYIFYNGMDAEPH